jgi:putative acetyltransferase
MYYSHMRIRPEEPTDQDAVRVINTDAFDTFAEANLVDALREQANPTVSLVAENEGKVVGHIMFSPVTLDADPAIKIMGLAPMAVTPNHQRTGIGTALVRAGLEQCELLDYAAVIVLGHPDYHPRFGFQPASIFNITSKYDVPDEAFMALELQPEALEGKSGTIHYHEAFSDL